MCAEEKKERVQPLLELRGIGKSYTSPGSPPNEVLKGIDLKVQSGESVAVVGPSGSGKTTLLNIIGSLDTPSEGSVFLNGMDLSKQSPRQLASIRNQEIGFIFQMHHLLPQCTVLENVLMPTLACQREGDPSERAFKLLDRVGLRDKADSSPAQLSGGESQRVAVVRSLINRPKLILADEPTGSLDRGNSANIAQLLADLNAEQNTSLIVVTHEDVLSSKMERGFELLDGRLTAQ